MLTTKKKLSAAKALLYTIYSIIFGSLIYGTFLGEGALSIACAALFGLLGVMSILYVIIRLQNFIDRHQ